MPEENFRRNDEQRRLRPSRLKERDATIAQQSRNERNDDGDNDDDDISDLKE